MIEIRINAYPDQPNTVEQQINEAMAALGFYRRVAVSAALAAPYGHEPTDIDVAEAQPEMTVDQAKSYVEVERETMSAPAKPATRKRRTKAEIEAAKGSQPDPIEEVRSQISTGENRVGPEDSPETQAQDAADEAAEAAATATPDVLTVDDVRRAVGLYVAKFGIAAAQSDGLEVFKRLFPDGSVVKMSDLSDASQETLGKVVAGMQELYAKNPFGRAAVSM